MSAFRPTGVPQPADALLGGQTTATDAASWRRLVEWTGALIGRVHPGSAVVAVALEIDRFAEIVAARGPAAAEGVLAELRARVSQRLSSLEGELWAGGNLLVSARLLPHGVNQLGSLREAILACCDQAFLAEQEPLAAVVNVGIACSSGSGDDAQSLLSGAQSALAEARRMYGTRLVVLDADARERVTSNFEITQELHRAVQRGEFALEYQPIVELAAERVTWMEALLRWNSARGGQIVPDEFIPQAEESGLIVPIGRWVVREVIRTWSVVPPALLPWRPLGVTVNVSAAQFDGGLGGLSEDLETAAAALPGRLLVEVTESRRMLDVDAARASLEWLRSIGVGIVIDDFGTGYSSMEYLRAFPVDAVKIDRCFVQQLDTDPRDRSIVASIIELARSLDIVSVAEGVETDAQLRILRDMGCDAAQGFYLGAPAALQSVLGELSGGESGPSRGAGIGPRTEDR